MVPPLTAPAGLELHDLVQFEDRQEHTNHNRADHHPQEHNQQGLNQRSQRRQRRFNDAIQGYTNGVVLVYTSLLNEMSDKEKSIVNDAHALRSILSEIDKDRKEIEYLINELRDAYRYAVDLFRGSNQAVRDTPPPKYFIKDPLPLDIEDLVIHSSIIEKARGVSANLEDHLMELRAAANSEKAVLRSRYGQTLKNAAAFIENIYTDAVGDSLPPVKDRDPDLEISGAPAFRIIEDGLERESSHVYA